MGTQMHALIQAHTCTHAHRHIMLARMHTRTRTLLCARALQCAYILTRALLATSRRSNKVQRCTVSASSPYNPLPRVTVNSGFWNEFSDCEWPLIPLSPPSPQHTLAQLINPSLLPRLALLCCDLPCTAVLLYGVPKGVKGAPASGRADAPRRPRSCSWGVR